MIYFVTNNTNYYTAFDKTLFPDIEVIDELGAKAIYHNMISKKRILAVDIEATGLDAYLAQPLLYGIGTESVQLMFDWTVDVTYIFEHMKKYNIIALGHNLKYDIKIIKTNTNVLLERLYDTMICEQRIWMKSGYLFAYAELVKRYLKKQIIKSTRNEFIGVDISKFKINPSHLYYLKGDLVDLFEIRRKQRYYINKFNMQFLIYGIEFPLIPAIALAELKGFTFNSEKWLEKLVKNKQALFDTAVALDDKMREIRDFVSHHGLFKGTDPKSTLGGSKYNNVRKLNPDYDMFNSDGTSNVLNIFGETMSHRDITGVKRKINLYPNNVDWNAKKEIVYIFARLEQPLPTPTEQYIIPQLNANGRLIGSVDQFTIKEDFLQKYILQKPNSIMLPLIELLIKHSKIDKAVSTYGENFIKKINPKTGKIHTIFRQCDADTGRFQSGGGKKDADKYNAQNIPRDIEYRQCFTTDTTVNSIMTADYSGAELIVMASHAQDFKLIELSEGDMHSHMATKCWKNIFAYRAKRLLDLFTKSPHLKSEKLLEEYRKNVKLYKEYVVTKEMGKERTAFKPLTFGCIYGMYPKKAGASLNVIPEEGKVVIQTIKGEVPLTFAMVEKASDDAEKQGYVILNSRTNARAWFPNLIKQIKKEISKETHFMLISAELSAARNIRIQGTQADFVKEASVVLYKYFKILKKKFDIDATMLSWVHDEIVFEIPKYLDGVSQAYIDFTVYNPDFLLQSPTTGKTYPNLREVIIDIMESVADRYLNNVHIKAENEVKPYWVK